MSNIYRAFEAPPAARTRTTTISSALPAWRRGSTSRQTGRPRWHWPLSLSRF